MRVGRLRRGGVRVGRLRRGVRVRVNGSVETIVRVGEKEGR